MPLDDTAKQYSEEWIEDRNTNHHFGRCDTNLLQNQIEFGSSSQRFHP